MLTNELTNADFETGDPPSSWTREGGTGLTISRDGSIKHGGSYSIKLVQAGGGENYVYQNIHTVRGYSYWVGRTVTLGAWVYANVANSASVFISNGSTYARSPYHSGTPGWEYLSVDFTVPAGGTVVSCLLINDVIGCTAYFDDAVAYDAAVPRKYAIELRDKNGYLKERLEPFVTSFNWEWNRIGGCGRATFKISGDYLRFDIEADDDVRIWLPGVGGSAATLVYRGYVEGASPDLSSGDQVINLECNGYFNFLDRVIVDDDGDQKVYEGMEISAIVGDIIDTFVVPKTSITKGTVQESGITADYLEFKGKAKDVLSTLFDLVGIVEYGVNASLQFYWYNQSKEFSDRLYITENVVKISNRMDYKSILNKIYFEGGDVNGSAFRTVGQSLRSQQKYGLFEDIISNGSITTGATADQYIKAILKQRAIPQRQLSVSVKNTSKRWETNYPMGAIAVIDPAAYQDPIIWGTTASGGSNLLYGKTINGGSGKKYGTTPRNQIDRIRYTATPEDGYCDAEIQFGNSLSVSRASATLKLIEKNLDTVRQRSL